MTRFTHASLTVPSPIHLERALSRSQLSASPRLGRVDLVHEAVPQLVAVPTGLARPRVPAAVPAHLRVRTRAVGRLPNLPARRRSPVATVDLSRREAALPFGTPRFVTVAILKRLAGGKGFDRLLRKVGDRWEFVADDVMVDLTDGTQQFKLGRLTIFS
jgi:hypothetical protein